MALELPLRVGVVGAGFMGQLHARVVRELPYAVVRAVCDVDGERSRRLAQAAGASAYTDVEAMLGEEVLDAVIVATPEDRHRAAVEAAARHRLPVMVEKPLATSPEDAAAMVETCRLAGVILMVGYILRFEPAYIRLRQAIEAGRLGQLVSVYARRNAPVQEALRLQGRTNPIDYLACHDIDQVLWYHPRPVRRVMAHAAYGPTGRRLGVPDMTWIWMEFDDGAVALIESGWSLPARWAGWHEPDAWGGFGDVRMDVIGSEGMLSLDLRQMNTLGVDAEGWKFPDTRHWPESEDGPLGAVKNEVEHFLRCVLHGRQPIVDGQQAQQVVAITAAAHQSLNTGAAVLLA